jgi:hypothetical protein
VLGDQGGLLRVDRRGGTAQGPAVLPGQPSTTTGLVRHPFEIDQQGSGVFGVSFTYFPCGRSIPIVEINHGQQR